MDTRTPADLIREGVDVDDLVAVQTAAGLTLHVTPAVVTPSQILAGRVSEYARAAWTLRDQWARAALPGGDGQPDWALLSRVVVLAMQDMYPEATAADVDAWLDPEADGEASIRIAQAACGFISTPRARLRARAIRLSIAGLADVPLTAQEAAPLDDWTRNAQVAP